MGKMGRSNLSYAMKQDNLVPVAVCDVYQRNLDWAVKISKDQASAGLFSKIYPRPFARC